MTAGVRQQTAFFADIAGSTRITEESGDLGARDILSACLDLMDECVRKHGGTVSRRIGDELLCLFASADAAACGASELHTAVTAAGRSGRLARPMRLRIGFEHGDVVEHEGELFGQTVHTAARLASLAKAGQTLTTQNTLDRINPGLRALARYFDTVVLKGLRGEQEVFDLPWTTDSATWVASGPVRRPAANGAVELEHDGRTFRVDAERPRLEIGRDPTCDLQVAGLAVSMIHAHVVWNRGRVRLEDISSNGTTIRRDDAGPLTLRRETALLLGSGLLLLGDATDESAGARVRYRCYGD